MHSMEDDVAVVFKNRSEAQKAIEELSGRGLANQHLVDGVHGSSPIVCDVNTDKAVFGSVARGVVVGIAGGVTAGVLLMLTGMGLAGAELRLVPLVLAGGFGGFAAGVFFGFVGGAVATERLLYEEERWGDVPLAEGEVLVVATPPTDRKTVREILESHGGRPVEAPPHHEMAA